MAIDITGINTEKIDKLAAAVVELRATGRIVAFGMVLLVPIMAGGIGYLISQSSTSAARTAALEERTAQIEKRFDERFNQIEKRLDQVEKRLDRIEAKIDKLIEKK
ncbi:MAG TPA: hypothetical protein VH120_04460 [Gemmataceae bacterium]|jgi:tetrahydromethanopterin S-methyltransferase subunit G|nr:hypothetical protein [Gemmataceae bacterium]